MDSALPAVAVIIFVTGDDIFHFVYGKLHDPNYREAYAADF